MVIEFFTLKKHNAINTLNEELQEKWVLEVSYTLWKLLFNIDFKYLKTDNCEVLMKIPLLLFFQHLSRDIIMLMQPTIVFFGRPVVEIN